MKRFIFFVALFSFIETAIISIGYLLIESGMFGYDTDMQVAMGFALSIFTVANFFFCWDVTKGE